MSCSNQCITNVCSTNITPNEVWNYDVSGSPFPDGANDTIYDENIEQLRLSINDERSRRGMSAYSFTPSTIYGSEESGTNADIIGQNSLFKELKTAINQIRPVISYSYSSGQPIYYGHILELKYDLDTLRSECICYGNCGSKTTCSCYGDCCDYGSVWI